MLGNLTWEAIDENCVPSLANTCETNESRKMACSDEVWISSRISRQHLVPSPVQMLTVSCNLL